MIKALQDICDHNTELRLFVGVGNVLKSDDGVGVYICRNIRETDQCKTLPVEVSLENYIGKINSINPDLLIIIDCVDLKAEPGSYMLLTVDQIQDFTFNTHNISIKRLAEFFTMPTYILGIQPENLNFGEAISKQVLEAANLIIQKINIKEISYG